MSEFWDNAGSTAFEKLESAARSITGYIPRAILCVRKYDALKDSSGKFIDAQTAVNDAQNKAKALMNRTKFALGQSGTDTGGDSDGSNQATLTDAGNYIELEVQYNPSSIKMDTQAGRQVQKSAENPNQLNIVKQPTSTTMSFQLVFDALNTANAFGQNSGTIYSTGLATITSIAGTESAYTVKDKMDGIMALLMSPVSRHVIFFWSQMCFVGEVTSVESKYIMFNKQGHPIRGTIDLSIRQGGDNGNGVKYNSWYWDAKYEKIFGAGGTDVDFNNNAYMAKAGNVLNLWM